MLRLRIRFLVFIAAVLCSEISCLPLGTAPIRSAPSVELTPIAVEPKHPEKTAFGSLTLLSAFRLSSRDKRFGGLSGLAIGSDARLYAVSDYGFWISAAIVQDRNDVLLNLVDWQIAPILMPGGIPVNRRLRDAEALSRTNDESFLVAFEGIHRIWRYAAPPQTLASVPANVPIPRDIERAPSNGGMEGIASLADGRLLIFTEEFENRDGSFKGWLMDGGGAVELSYVAERGFHVTDCAALENGDVLVLERRYMPLGILSARLTLVKGNQLLPGAKLVGTELLKLEQPLATENYEGLAVQRTSRGTVIFIISDDNYSPFQETLLLQFLLPDAAVELLTSHGGP